MQAVHVTSGIMHEYTTLMMLWKFIYYSSKHAESLKVLDLPELKIVKQSDRRWLAHEHCIKAVKASFNSIVMLLKIYMQHLSIALSSHSTIAAIYLLDYILPQVAKLSCAIET